MYLMISESSFIDTFSKYQRRQFGFQSLVLELKLFSKDILSKQSDLFHYSFDTKTFQDKLEIEIYSLYTLLYSVL